MLGIDIVVICVTQLLISLNVLAKTIYKLHVS